MAIRPDGSGWHGWVLLAGVPATITAFTIGGPIGLVALAATIGAFKHGSQLEAQAKTEREDAAAESRRARAATESIPKGPMAAWDAECEALWKLRDDGVITEEAFDQRWDDLIDRCPI